MKLVLDAMGGDHAPHEIVTGAVQYARQSGSTILLVGQEEAVRAELSKHDTLGLDLPVIHASETLQMDEKPALAARRKKDNSMVVGMRLVKEGAGDAFLTMGHTGGALTAGHMVFRRIPGVHRAVLSTPFPNHKGFHMLGDIGANPDCRPEWLAQWGQMLAVFARARLGAAQPRIALLSNGEEEGKGTDLTRAAEPLLAAALGSSYIGVIEPKEMMSGAADAVVTDGFTGNVTIKLSEALASYIFSVIRQEIKARPLATAGAALAKPALVAAANRLDDREYGAALLLGLNGLVMVGHGRSKADRVVGALRSTAKLVDAAVLEQLRAEVAAAVGRTSSGGEDDDYNN